MLGMKLARNCKSLSNQLRERIKMTTIRNIENEAIEKAFSINSEIDNLIGENNHFNEIENKTWESLLERNGIEVRAPSWELSALDHIIYSIAGIFYA